MVLSECYGRATTSFQNSANHLLQIFQRISSKWTLGQIWNVEGPTTMDNNTSQKDEFFNYL